MSNKLKLNLVTPERTVISEEADSITCPTGEGYITILPGHADLISTIVSGELTVKNGGVEHFLHVSGGFVHVSGDNEIRVLSDAAEHHAEIDITRAEEARKLAEQQLNEQILSDEEYAATTAILRKNLSRIKIARKHAHRRTRITGEGVFHSE